MAIFNGNDLVLLVNNQDSDHYQFAHSKEVSLSYNCSMVEVTKGKTDTWTEVIPGIRETTLTFSGLTDYGTITERRNITDLGDYLLNEDLIYFQLRHEEEFHIGTGYISEISIDGGVDNVSGYSGSLVMTGELTRAADLEEHFLLKEDGDFVLQENGDKLIILV